MSFVDQLNTIKSELYRLVGRIDSLIAATLADSSESESDYSSEVDDNERQLFPSPPSLQRELTIPVVELEDYYILNDRPGTPLMLSRQRGRYIRQS